MLIRIHATMKNILETIDAYDITRQGAKTQRNEKKTNGGWGIMVDMVREVNHHRGAVLFER
jgi:hypothetical protein